MAQEQARAVVPETSTLYHSLCLHGFSDFEETSDVCAGDVVAGHTILIGGLEGVLVDIHHDAFELLVNLFAGPTHTQAVLAHLKS